MVCRSFVSLFLSAFFSVSTQLVQLTHSWLGGKVQKLCLFDAVPSWWILFPQFAMSAH